jgi:two-component system chemotaxis response regulator CheB
MEQPAMAVDRTGRPVVVVGGSAGGLEALRSFVAGLSADFPAPVLVVIHIPATGPSRLAEVLSRAGPLPATQAHHLDALLPGRILVAPPDRHLLVQDGLVLLGTGPKENRHRPAIDALFRTAARWHGPGVVGVVLSGALDDGASGAAAIAAQDGQVVVQDPDDALVSAMPRAALNAVRRALVAPAVDLGELVTGLVRRSAPVGTVLSPSSEASMTTAAPLPEHPAAGRPMALGCPDCHGGMFEQISGELPYYACHVGHSWSPQTLLDAQRHAVEAALWNAASKLLEVALVHDRLAEAERAASPAGEAHRDGHRRAAKHARTQANAVSELISRAVPDVLDDAVAAGRLPVAAEEG